MAPLAFTVTLMDVAEFQTLVEEVLNSKVGLVVFGDIHDTAIMKADESLATLGIEAPRMATN